MELNIIIASILIGATLGYDVPKIPMDNFCHQSFIADPCFLVTGSSGQLLGPDTGCSVEIKSYSQKESYVVAVIDSLNINCSLGHLDIYDGDNKIGDGLCGSVSNKVVYSALNHKLDFFLTTTGVLFPGSFNIITTSFSKGVLCTENENTCSNGYCIAKGLVCDGYNNCGDNSDELNCQSFGVSNIPNNIVVGIMALLTCVLITKA